MAFNYIVNYYQCNFSDPQIEVGCGGSRVLVIYDQQNARSRDSPCRGLIMLQGVYIGVMREGLIMSQCTERRTRWSCSV